MNYLGVLIDSNLTWKHHISCIASKISENIGIICKLRHFTPFSTLLNIYQSHIFPIIWPGCLGLGCQIWHRKDISSTPKKGTALMNFANFSSHAVSYFVSSKVLPKNLLYYKLTSLLMLDVHNNSVPSTLSDMFTRTHCMHNYNKRSSSAGNYYINYSRTNQR